MYLELFKLKRLPFKLTSDTQFHYLAGERLRAKLQLSEAIETADGPILVVAESGMGKTILLEDCVQQLEPYMRVAFVRHPDMTADEFYEAAVAQLSSQEPATKADARAAVRFEETVIRLCAAGEQVLVAVDNGEIASPDLLDDILRLCRRRRAGVARVSVIVAGRLELRHILSGVRFEAEDRRPSVEIHLKSLPMEQIQYYVEHRLAAAGFDGPPIFAPDAHTEIMRFTGGVPQLINTLADAAMTAAFGRNHATVAGSDVRTVASQLRWTEFSARTAETTTPAVSAQTLSAYIRVELNSQLIAEHVLNVGRVTLGRALRNDIRINSEFVSRDHCRILTNGTSSVIEDLQSQNGLLIKGQRVSVHRLHDGDVIQVGDHSITYRRGLPRQVPGLVADQERSAGNSDTVETRLITSTEHSDSKEFKC